MITEQEIVHYISKQPRHIAGYKQILHDLGIRGKERRPLEQLLRDMTHRKKLVAIGKGRWSLPTSASSQDVVVGRLRMHRDGYGFVTPDTDALPPRARGKLLGDIFIPPPEIGSAMHGDQVLVELGRIRPDGKGEGRILRVTERQQETVVGIFHYGDRYNFVKPIDEKVAMDIIIPHGQEYPRHGDQDEFQPSEADRDVKGSSQHPSSAHSTRSHSTPHEDPSRIPNPRERSGARMSGEGPAPLPLRGEPTKSSASHQRDKKDLQAHHSTRLIHPRQQTPHRVLGEESRRRTWDDLENVVVEVEITQWPSANQNPRGRVVEILGYEDDFGVDVEIIIRKHHIRHVFPPAVLEEAQEISPVIPKSEIAHRRDFRDLPIVTIDGETARDFDDAVFVQRLPNGNYQLHVHIADVAQYVEDGTALDEEARLRGTSVYFPDRAVPMLPLELSTDICSLRPELDRLVLSCIMEIDAQGEIHNYELAEGVIRSAARMTYTDVNAILEGDPHLRRRYSAMANNFELMLELAKILNRRRVKRGSIDFDLPEPVIEFDDFGLMKSISPSERNWAHRLIEEFMLAANETVASHLERLGIASLYRIHEKPDPKRIFDFETIAASFGYSLGVGALPIKRVTTRADKRSHYGSGRRAPTVELPEEVHITPRMYQKLVQKISGKPEERVLSYLMLRSLKQARYSEINEGHFALAAPSYTHFTSPIRRYPDLIVHRILKDVLHDHGGPMHGRMKSSEEQSSPWSKRGKHDSSPRKHGTEQASFSPRRHGDTEEARKRGGAQSATLPKRKEIEGVVARAPSPAPRIQNEEDRASQTGRSSQERVAQNRGPRQSRFSIAGVENRGPRQSRFSIAGVETLLSVHGGQREADEDQKSEGRAEVRERPSSVTPCLRGEQNASAHHLTRSVAAYRNRPHKEEGHKQPHPQKLRTVAGLNLETLHDIAESSSQTERAADDAERELMEWKKVKFMQDRIGEDFAGLIVSVTKYGFFVELTDLFIEGLVPLDSLQDDRYTFRENTRQIIGDRSRKTFSIGDQVRVLVDRIDHAQRKIQFALFEEAPSRAQKRHKKSRR